MNTVVNSLGPSDTTWRQRSGTTLAQAMAWCLTALSHHLNQCLLIITHALWHSPQGNSIRNAQDIYPWHAFENCYFHICLRHQWVKSIDIYPQQNTIKHEPCIIIFEMHGTMMTTMLKDMGMLSWWTFLVLLPLCLMFPASICKSSEDLAPADFIYP